ncbi:MAG TPA: AbrB/MazE/SpoVT family DNA-binding domain-containing protein [Dongiaceae bacterium]|nr:AbrB/MazE/SpoVT family DNA-binding domain-containing protein [Dongiaceae bacterium]
MQVAKWGNSLAVRLPASVVKALQLGEGDDIEIQVAGARSFGIAKGPERASSWLASASTAGGCRDRSSSTGSKPRSGADGGENHPL